MEDKINIKQVTISGLAYRFAERIGAQFVSVIISIILARILLVEEYGIISLVVIIIKICDIFITNGFATALIQKKNADDTDYSSVLYASIFLSGVLYLLVYFEAPYVARFYNKDILILVLRIMGLHLPVAAFNSVQHAYVSQNLLFKKFFFATIIGTVMSGIFGIVMALKGYGVWALVAQYLSNAIFDTLVLLITISWRPKLLFSFNRVKGLLSFGWKILVAGLLEQIYDVSRSLVIGKKYSITDFSYYTKGKQFPTLIVNNIATTITNIMFPIFALYQDDKIKLKAIVRRSVQISSYVLMPLLIGFLVIAEPFVSIVLTEKWLGIVPFIRVFCIMLIFKPLKNINRSALKAIGRSDIALYLSIIEKGIGITLIFITMQYGPFWLAVSAAITYFIGAIINAIPNSIFIKYSFSEQLSDFTSPVLMSLIMGISTYTIAYLPIHNKSLILLQISFGIAIYVFISIITKCNSYYYILKTIRIYRNRIMKKQN